LHGNDERIAVTTVASDRVVKHLSSHPERRVCAGCLARELGLPRNTAFDVVRRLEGRRDFSRAYGVCSACRSDRMVVGAIAA
jgi:ribosomal protein L34E